MKQVMLCLTLLLLFPLPAAASVLYDWSGTCLTGCVGTATWHVETVDTYVPGVSTSTLPGGAAALLAAQYTDSNLTFTSRPVDPEVMLLPDLALGGPSLLWFFAEAFTEKADGTWKYEAEVGGAQFCDPVELSTRTFCEYLATGVGGVWSLDPPARVPWPATALLLLVGFVPTAVFILTTR